MMAEPSRRITITIIGGCLAMAASPLAADGWHNAALATASLDEWLQEVKAAVPDLDQRLENASLRAGQGADALKAAVAGKQSQGTGAGGSRGRLDAQLTPQQAAMLGRKANDCLEVLAYMQPQNIFPSEFPRFDLNRIPQYRKAARELLQIMGEPGGSAVSGTVRKILMGANLNQSDVQVHPEFGKELLQLLTTSIQKGQLSPQDLEGLQQASAGRKPAGVEGFARNVRDILAKEVTVLALMQWISDTTDARTKEQLLGRLKNKLTTAPAGDLVALLQQSDLDAGVRRTVADRLSRELPELGVGELLGLMDNSGDNRLAAAASVELARRSPRFVEVEGQLPQIIDASRSTTPAVAAAAKAQLQNAFQRAPMPQCLTHLAAADAPVRALIWEQIDGRIQRADTSRRQEYRDTALALLQDSKGVGGEAALELLERLKDRSAVAPLADLLPRMPRTLWPRAGQALRAITGQDFGPKAGSGVAEVIVASKKWRQWAEQQGLNGKK